MDAMLSKIRSAIRSSIVDFGPGTALEKAIKKTHILDDVSTQAHISKLIALLAKSINAKTIIETGTFRGLTSANLAVENPDAEIYTFEYDGRNAAEAKGLFRKMKFRNVHLIEGDVLVELPKLAKKLKKIDVLFVDDSKKNYRKNFEAVLPKLKVGGVVAAHDTSLDILGETHTKKFKECLLKRKDFSVIEVDREDRGLTIAQRVK